ncbi:MFS general substrate transporter [Thelephora ganbajun]|uniref:MFS general substrate transporter n=1 Tax=Thelephora ganbajun TaxID=370292 RepID=A0ACB6ZJQ4_THEGA|nr:MFS general substrate transporter [Thelephora ganbajun]
MPIRELTSPTLGVEDTSSPAHDEDHAKSSEQTTNSTYSHHSDGGVPASKTRSAIKSTFLVLSCAGAMIINTANATSVSIALPTIGADLGVNEDQLQWVVSSYSLTAGCLLLLIGRLADLYGRKKMFVAGALWLTAFAIGCAFANDNITLNVLRALQGIGGAAIIPASIGILAAAFPPSQARSTAFATFGAGAPIGSVFGTTIGAVVVELTNKTWRSVFYVSAGVAALIAVGGALTIDPDQPSEEKDKRVDWFGSALITSGLVLIIFVLSDGAIAPHGWRTPYIIGCLVAGVILSVLFFCWNAYLSRAHAKGGSSTAWWQPPPLIPGDLWLRANGRFLAILMIVFWTWCSFLSNNFWLFYQNYLRLSPILTMVRLLPSFVTGIICNVLIALLVGRIPVVYLIGVGTLLTAFGSIFFSLVEDGQSYWSYGFPSAVIIVFGADFVFSSGTLFIAKCALPHEQSVAGALFSVMTQVGTAFGLAITTIVYNAVLESDARSLGVDLNVHGSAVPRAAQLHAYQDANWGAFAFGILACLIAIVSMAKVGVVGQRGDAKPKEDTVELGER